jgi:hypothetical protein
MSTQEIDGKNYIKTERADGTILFTPVVEKRIPEAGEIWIHPTDKNSSVLMTNHGFAHFDEGIFSPNTQTANSLVERGFEFVGKTHSEVYVNRAEFIAEVRAALSIKDGWGDNVLASSVSSPDVIHVCEEASIATREALRKLNIITD